MADKRRETFLSYRDVLGQAVARFRAAEAALRSHADEAVERYAMIFRSVADVEAKLAQNLAAYAEEGPEKLLASRLQYQSHHGWPEEAHSLGDAIAQLINFNKEYANVFHEASLETPVPELSEALETICLQIEAANRRISQIRALGHDL